MDAGECISCGHQIPIQGSTPMGTKITCPECQAELELVWLEPIELDWPFEDFDDDDEDYYYDED